MRIPTCRTDMDDGTALRTQKGQRFRILLKVVLREHHLNIYKYIYINNK